jgi:hypothetical protein
VGGSPFDGTCELAAVSDDTKVVTLSNLPIGFQLSRGDYLAWPYGDDDQALHRCSAAAAASAEGTLSVEVRPYVEPVTLSPAPAVSLHRASCRMVVVPDSLSMPVDGDRHGIVSAKLIQTY